MYKYILLAVDGSKNSVRAGIKAAKLAALVEGSTVEILYVVDPLKVKEEVLHSRNHEEIELNAIKSYYP